MLARLQQFIVLGGCAVAIGCAAYFAQGWLVALIVLCGLPVVLALEFILLGVFRQTGATHRNRARELFGAWRGEVVAAARVFFWLQPFRSNVEPDHVPAQTGSQCGVVLVHGLLCNRGIWTPLMSRLRTGGVPFIAVNLEPLFGSIDRYAAAIDSAVKRMALATGQPVVLVGHSMGGLAIRAWLDAFGSKARVQRVLTIATPHRGTWLARWAHTHNGRQMRQGSDWLHRLQAREPVNRQQHFTCFFSDCDNIVFPAEVATLVGADNRHLPGTGHVQLVFHAAVADEVWRWLAAPAIGTEA